MFAPVILLVSNFASIKDLESIDLQCVANINAPRLPLCATSLIEFENLSMKGTTPVDVKAAFLTVEPCGLTYSKVVPTPARLLHNCINS